MIEVQNLSKTFGNTQALNRISFKIERGEIFGLLGLNGAGKTTCLRILSTVLTPTSGSVRVLGKNPFRKGIALRRQMGVLSSETHLPGRFSPFELAEMMAKLYFIDHWEQRFQELVESLRMESYAHRMVANFSTGMKQKTALLLSFLHDPPVLLLDEPTAGLDIPSARTIRDFLHENIVEKKTVLVCSHHLHEVQALCHRVGIIHRGEIVVQGDIHSLLQAEDTPTLEDLFLKYVSARG